MLKTDVIISDNIQMTDFRIVLRYVVTLNSAESNLFLFDICL